MSHLAYIVEPNTYSGFVWDVFNRYTGTSVAFGIAPTRHAAKTAAHAAIADLLSR